MRARPSLVCAAAVAALALLSTGCGQHLSGASLDGHVPGQNLPQVDSRLSDASSGDDWPAFGRTYGEQHFSPLSQIDERNVADLGLVWSMDLPAGNSVTGPLEVGGVVFFANRHSEVHAVDAVTGRELWSYDSQAAEKAGRRLRLAYGSRGIAWWNGKIYTGTTDGRLIALDGTTGKELWSALTFPPNEDVRYISGPPRIFDGKVIIGHGGADAGTTRGYVTAYDAETGKLLWRFYTVPGNPAVDTDETTRIAAKSWAGEWWKFGGGGTVWNAITYDADTDTIFLGTGNGFPWNHRIRSLDKGDNLFLCSVVALDAKTGRYKWHYQINPAETWDYNAAMDMQVADLVIDGQPRKVLMTAPKNGFFYVIDRITGKLISAQPFAKVNWASHIDLSTGRPVEIPEARYPNGKTFVLWPSPVGAHSWLPMAFSPKTNLVYIPTIELAHGYNDKGVDLKRWVAPSGNVMDVGLNLDFNPKSDDPTQGTSYLQAWDPVTQKRVWSVPTPGFASGGVAATAGGIVFQGRLDGKFNGYSAATGKLLWSYDVGAPVVAPPITYLANGRQYVTVISGAGTTYGIYAKFVPFTIDYRTQARRVLTFAVGGTAKLPPSQPTVIKPADDRDYRADAASAARGGPLYEQMCSSCHGYEAIGGGTAPDLRASVVPLDPDVFRSVVKDGALVPNGMPQFEEFDDRKLNDIRQYIRANAHLMKR